MSTKDIIMGDEHWEEVEPGTESLVEEWLVNEGDTVEPGQVIVNVVVVKTNIEVTTPVGGVIEKIIVAAEDTFAKGAVLATIQEA